ncbi:MAG: tetratricopeptide repeat protein [Verrucomicrobiota bacterium]|nr:tetratricopeptide repeat protein [Verrucomicrobiota bacterium]
MEQESHHFAAARDAALRLAKIETNKSRSYALLGDALLESGDVAEAATAFDQMQQHDPEVVESETRLARLELARGATDAARSHFEKALAAAKEPSQPETEAVLWCELQLGQLAFNTGDWDAAEKYYRMAGDLRPDDSRVLEHLGELRAAQEKYDEALSFFEKAISRAPRPEFWQALGDVYLAMGKPAEAASWHGRARDAFLENVREGNDHYFHHLAGFYSDVEENGTEAVKWARRDLTLRHTAAAHDALAWGLYRAGEPAAAAQEATTALASGTRDAHILFHAGMIFLAAGDMPKGKATLAEAARVNPRHQSFHVHR